MHQARTNRLQFIQDHLRQGHLPTFEAMQDLVAQKFGPIKMRMLREDLNFLRNEGLNGHRLSIKVIEGKYTLQNDNDFSIHSLKDSERGTLPLLFSILKPYERFPAVAALLTNLIQVHKLNDAEIKQLTWGVGKSARSLSDQMIQRIVDILGCITKQVAVEFNYHKVTEDAIENQDENILYPKIYPLQVRTFEDRYYLVGIEVGKAVAAEKSCIFVLLCGGPSHVDTWDMKPAAPDSIRGPYKPMATKLPAMNRGVTRWPEMSRSRFSTAASATAISTSRATSGA